ncbi:(2S)-3-sulfopropanediol dehydratase activating enzyme [Clostridium cylindrosporum]|uniref:4-hydroxyphenylacetate decarboxylase activating enzyme n=1 Tax=Clostridium cylindrosporum DSM 605 TaxID=1121307 RepID=A0A0J8D7D8_CLOCY|nr:glycyl-radical enzyme activating protein [Clostridium cylindrosporum]KMT21812.1 4-hydroxyphenylacetate decarboxylase activating enzyme [Clostridium cylindrosporum DSM 605]
MYKEKSDSAYVLNIQHYSLHDGPGIRTLVFLKGCPLRCRWCANPESQSIEPQVAFNHLKCIGERECGRCIKVCEGDSIHFDKGKAILNHKRCTNCLKCVDACPSGAISVYGKLMNYKEVLKIVEKDSNFYARSGGGLTISGGEPLLNGDFTIKLLREARKRRINTAIETSGYGDFQVLSEIAKHLDTIIFDIKCISDDQHKKYTGVSRNLILDNFTRLCIEYPHLKKIVRTPVIPGFNDNEYEIYKIIDFLSGKENIKYELLQYHRFGEAKYGYIGKEYLMGDVTLSDEKMDDLRRMVKEKF